MAYHLSTLPIFDERSDDHLQILLIYSVLMEDISVMDSIRIATQKMVIVYPYHQYICIHIRFLKLRCSITRIQQSQLASMPTFLKLLYKYLQYQGLQYQLYILIVINIYSLKYLNTRRIAMCSRGVFQLKKMLVFFCDYGGSSNGVRNMITSTKMKQFMENNQQIQFDIICKRNHHPYVRGSYLNGYNKDMPLRNYEEDQVYETFKSLRNQLGRQSFKASGTRVLNAKKSIQGPWQANLFNKYPLAELQRTHEFPEIPEEYQQKYKEQRNVRKLDQAHKFVRTRPLINPHRERL